MEGVVSIFGLLLLCIMQCEGQAPNTAPVFDFPSYNFQLDEEVVPGTSVGVVRARDAELDVLTYSIEQSIEDATYFSINSSSGLITTTRRIDRENLASQTLRFTADVRDPSFLESSVNVFVLIIDINDHAPVFSNLPAPLDIPENTPVLTSVYAARASDLDQSLNSQILYRMVPNDTFGINRATGIIRLNEELDYDVPDGRSYLLTIFAQDRAAMDPRGVMATLNISVIDINDQDPIFDQALYSVEVHENLTIGASIVTVRARDQDEGINDDILYSIHSGNLMINGTPSFSINQTTGLITVNVAMLDREQHADYTLEIEGTERTSITNRNFTMVLITVLDINDHVPTFERQFYQRNISELIPVNDSVINLIAFDRDEDEHGTFEFMLINVLSNEELPFAVTSSSIEERGMADITLIRELDFESVQRYVFLVVATEVFGSGTRNGTTTVELSVINENDNNPYFLQDMYTASISENNAPSAMIVQVEAFDGDRGSFGQLRFRLSDEDVDKPFNISTLPDNRFGVVMASQSLNFEQQDNYNLTVIVEDLGGRTNSTQVYVELENVNDNRPMFVHNGAFPDTINVTLLEELPDPEMVLMLEATDDDGSLNDLTFSIVDGDIFGFFDIQAGYLVTTTELNFDLTAPNTKLFSLLVLVNDSLFVDRLRVNVRLLDINDNSPVFVNDSYSFSVVENSASGEIVGQVEAVDIDSGSFGQVVYFLSGPSIATDRFQVNRTSGQIIVAGNIDREETPGPLEFTVIASDLDSNLTARRMNSTTVTIAVVDTNDNAPSFNQSGYIFRVAENTNTLTDLAVSASDPDLGSSGTIRYSIVDGNDEEAFVLDAMAGSITRNGTVVLDFERTPIYLLNVSAEDSGVPSQVTVIPVVIEITDENDNDPTFPMNQFNVPIGEDTPPDTIIIQLNATDEDSGEFGDRIYSIREIIGSAGSINGSFRIDSSTGEVITEGVFDREGFQGPYEVIVDVRDDGIPPRNGSASLFVTILDANDNSPIFDPVVGFSPIMEEQQPGIPVATIRATDRDLMNNSRIVYSISDISATAASPEIDLDPLNVAQHFALSFNNSVQIVTNISLDYELITSYEIVVTASDSGTPSLSAVIRVPVSVMDINDNTPMFIFPEDTTSYFATLPENSVTPTLLTFSASDRDSGQNGQVRFLPSNASTFPSDFFLISGTNLGVVSSLNFEDRQVYFFNVTVVDGGNPPRSSQAEVEIRILDLNDNRPMFSRDIYITEVDEGQYTSFPIAYVNATDIDSEDFGNVSYAIFPESDLFYVTKLDNGGGVVTVNGGLDRETLDQHTITILARDGGSPPQTATATVFIMVNDINDNSPVLNREVYSATIPEGAAPQVLQTIDVSATDSDLGENGRIFYYLSNDTYFSIDRESGVVRSLVTFDFEMEQYFVLEILAIDNGTYPRNDTAVLRIDISDINDNTPFFQNFTSDVSFPENTTLNSLIADINASDLDSTNNAQLVFQLTNDEGVFSINSNGQIRLAASLDRETTSSYNLTVTVSDRGQPPRSVSDYLYVEVTDINDVRPRFQRDVYTFLIAEDVGLGSVLGELLASDADEDSNANITFEIISQSVNIFSISTVPTDSPQTYSGVLMNDQLFDYESLTSYSLRVRARNIAPPYHQDTADVTVTIRDTNDNAPAFSMPEGYVLSVAEDTAIGDLIGTVVATDNDGGLNGTVVYGLASATDPVINSTFRVDRQSGVISLTSTLNFEAQRVYEFYVEASDLSDVPLISNISVIVNVQDANELAPVFDMESYSGSVMENVQSGAVITRVNATEREGGSNSVRYSLAAGNVQRFTIDLLTGIITTSQPLDREEQDRYVLTVQARDMAAVPLSSFVQVVVDVLDDNDNAPSFNLSSAEVNLLESSEFGTRLPQTFLATDNDIGSNAEIRYSLSPGSPFRVDPISGVISVTNPTSLDREAREAVPIQLLATDRGAVSLVSNLTIRVVLGDINDNTPRFSQSSYTASVPEDSSAGVSVIAVTATDRDLESALTFDIVSGDDTERKFRVNAVSGFMGLIETTTSPLDRETRDSYDLVVSVTDSGTPSRMSTATVTVMVSDVNDHTPVCQPSRYNFTTQEDNQFQVQLGTVTATDGDGSSVGSGQLIFTLAPSNFANNISVSQSGVVFARPGLDFEALSGSSFNFDVLVTDQPSDATTRRSAACTVEVNLVDTNDNIPVFGQSLYQANVVENVAEGTTVTVVQAQDSDSGANGRLRYAFLGPVDVFSIDAVSGVVTVSGSLDSDLTSRYDLNVEARDEGIPPRIGIARLLIIVQDINDNSPRFQQSFYDASIPEGSAPTTSVITVQATDRDSPILIYSIIGGNDGNYFFINSGTGVIQVFASPDREQTSTFNLLVLADDSAGNNGTATVRITVTDINDNRPVFQQSQYTAFIPENSLEGTPVLPVLNGSTIRIQAIDNDQPNTLNSRVVYRLEGSNAPRFNIDFASGIVTVARGANLNFETDPVVAVTIVATDSNTVAPMSNSARLEVRLLDVNDQPPRFTSPFGYAFRALENTTVNTIISTAISASDTETVGGSVRYELTGASPFAARTQFSINRTSGALTLLRSLDRETDATIVLVVTASDMGQPPLSSVVNVRVTVSDVNDNAPRFQQDIYTTTVPEFLATGELALRVSAADPDAAGSNSAVRYSVLQPTTAPFTINPTTGAITTTNTLDYETQTFHTFGVQACDSGTPVLCSNSTIRINVGDFNDEAPIFDQASYTTDVCFQMGRTGEDLVQPVATDRDSGSNADLVYSLSSSAPSLFTVAGSSGRVSLSRTLQGTGSYSFTIVATDRGATPLSGSAEVTIRVLNCSTSATDFYFLRPFTYLEVAEGDNIFRGFGGGNQDVTILLSSTPSSAQFFPNPNTNPFSNTLNIIRMKPSNQILPNLRQRVGLDREARSLYTIIMRAEDASREETFTSITLRVLDINDNEPEFTSDLYVFSVVENRTAPVAVGSVMATDNDEGLNAVLTYSIASITPVASPPQFTIDGTSGLISTQVELDREEITQYNIRVTVSDAGGRIDETAVQVTVEDSNDCVPTFVQNIYEVNILENLPQGSSVASVMATDCDEGTNALIRYTIAAGSLGVFQLDLISGVITTLTPLDFEQTPRYSLTVTATDMGSPNPSSSSVDVLFQVEDFNDCPPEFINRATVVMVPEDIVMNSVLETFSVQDCDSGLNGVNGTRFSIITGNEEGVFRIDPVSGVLRTVAALDHERRATYILTVQAADSLGGMNSLSSVTELNVTVQDVNDNVPVFAEDEISIIVSEGEELQQTLLTVQASDADTGRNGQITYSIIGGDGVFQIGTSSGSISLMERLDRENQDSYVLIVVGRDRAVEPRSSNTTIFVSVSDVNDNAPEILNIESGVTTVQVPELSDDGTEVYRINATDADEGTNAIIIYSLDDRSGNLPFSIRDGIIVVDGRLDYETQTVYSLVVIAEDTGTPTPLRGIATLVVRITDRNDNDPRFDPMRFVGQQDEGLPIGSSIIRVQATDLDEVNTPNSDILYFLDPVQSPDTIFFDIDNITGVISNDVVLDREERDLYQLTVVASNYRSSVMRRGSATVMVRVTDVNDESPVFSSALYTASVAERTALASPVLTVQATDGDMANTSNSDLIFSLTGETNNPFFIDPNSGQLTVQHPIDYEDRTFYQFEVIVEDKGVAPLRNTSTILINITDINDQVPRFSQLAYSAALSEAISASSSSPYLVTTLRYSDGDTDPAYKQSILTIPSVRSSAGQTIPNSMFTLFDNPQNNSAQLFLNGPLNFESTESYSLDIDIANINQGTGEFCGSDTTCTLRSSTTVDIQVIDVNDNIPVFSKSLYEGEVSTMATPRTNILSVMATDADSTANFRTISYSFNPPQDRFSIDSTTGTISTQLTLENLDGVVFTLIVEARDNNGRIPFNTAEVTVRLTVLDDFQRFAIVFNASLNVIRAKQTEIVSLLRNLTNFEIVVEDYSGYITNTTTTFIFHAIENGTIIDFNLFFQRIQPHINDIFQRFRTCNITRIRSFRDEFGGPTVVYLYPALLDTETIVILVLCFLLLVGSIILLIVALRQRYLALHAARHKLLADVFYGSHAGSSIVDHQENIQLELIETSGQGMNKQNPMFVHPYDNWAGVDTSGVESVGGDSNLQRDNPLYESQEIRMEMFVDVSDEEEEVDDERDEAELLAAALQEDSDLEEEDNSVTAI